MSAYGPKFGVATALQSLAKIKRRQSRIRHAILPRMSDQGSDDQYSDEEAARRATEALRRSLTMPRRTQKEMVGKVGAPNRGRPRRSPPVDKGEDKA